MTGPPVVEGRRHRGERHRLHRADRRLRTTVGTASTAAVGGAAASAAGTVAWGGLGAGRRGPARNMNGTVGSSIAELSRNAMEVCRSDGSAVGFASLRPPFRLSVRSRRSWTTFVGRAACGRIAAPSGAARLEPAQGGRSVRARALLMAVVYGAVVWAAGAEALGALPRSVELPCASHVRPFVAAGLFAELPLPAVIGWRRWLRRCSRPLRTALRG